MLAEALQSQHPMGVTLAEALQSQHPMGVTLAEALQSQHPMGVTLAEALQSQHPMGVALAEALQSQHPEGVTLAEALQAFSRSVKLRVASLFVRSYECYIFARVFDSKNNMSNTTITTPEKPDCKEYRIEAYRSKKDLPSLPDERFYHYTSSFDWYENISYYKPMMLVAFDGDRPIASMFALTMRMNRFLYGAFLKRCYVSQKPAFYDDSVSQIDVFGLFIDHLVKEVGWRVVFIEYRNLGDAIFGYKAFRENRFYSVKWMNIRNALRRKRSIWEQLSRTRKNQVNKAKKKGVVAEEIKSKDELPEIYKLIEKTKNWKITNRFPPYEYFENFFTHYVQQNKGAIILTRYQNKIIGGAILGFEKDTAYCLYYWGKTKRYKHLNPSVFSLWSAMETAAASGYQYFDFMDAGFLHERAGKPRFLLQFGGKQKASRRWYRINWSWLNFFAAKIYD